jgi:hypothetical protein
MQSKLNWPLLCHFVFFYYFRGINLRTLLFISAVLLVVGSLPLPIGYYTLLRIVVTASSLIILFRDYNGDIEFSQIIFGLIAILFNPVLPVYFNSKLLWVIIDISVAIIFIMKAFSNKTQNQKLNI